MTLPEKVEEIDLKEILNKSRIDINKKYDKPPIVLEFVEAISNKIIYKRVCTLGNFSCIKGKAKAKKTFLLSMIVSPLINNNTLYGKIKGLLPDNKRNILWFDTEQGEYDSYLVNKRINKLARAESEYFNYFNLREFEPLERCDIIEYGLEQFNNIGFVIIDGVQDLGKSINDEEEATRVTSLLLRLSKIYNIHICIIIHENKNDNFATGHLGSSVMKKAEAIISVKNAENNTMRVECDMIRGTSPFEDFYFEIDQESLLPIIVNYEEMQKLQKENEKQNYPVSSEEAKESQTDLPF